ncbi:hypothetical protein OCB70_25950 [Bacillus cereus]|uniref:hypothetical protein n=1 Tax=Bacillus TaxID=1386 RepID=UPI0009BE5F81|nr:MULTISPECIES: hypothetical protein [Bacillus cereus group]MCU5148752.1 hypothetical protein [Bacillus cereus]MCU5495741.1 hypothetical protein [Bacillus cereus]MCU5550570.1 hypothetical protein [Bacillus cereus]MCU5638634.1 hypothetical protein [Bacillus cereus]MCU5700499.1 hypothetical protein [Bacillus cereus]
MLSLDRSKVYLFLIVMAVNLVLGLVSTNIDLIVAVPFLALTVFIAVNDEILEEATKGKVTTLFKKKTELILLILLCLLCFCSGILIYRLM